MLFKTHIAISIFLALILVNSVIGQFSFVLILLIATLIPDIDSANSYISRKIKPLNSLFAFFSKHRGVFHSLTFCLVLTLIISFFSVKFALPFFLGYSFHLIADSFTVEGIRAFWPSKRVIKGGITTGGLVERILFYFLVIVDVLVAGLLLAK